MKSIIKKIIVVSSIVFSLLMVNRSWADWTIPATEKITIIDKGQVDGSVSGKYVRKFEVTAESAIPDISMITFRVNITKEDPKYGTVYFNQVVTTVNFTKGLGTVLVSSGDLDPGYYTATVPNDFYRTNVVPFTIQATTPPVVTTGGQEKVPSQAKCGAADGGTFSTAPDNALCDSSSIASDVTPAPSSGWNWTCVVTPYAPANCSANQSATAPKGSDPIKAVVQGTGSGSVNLGSKPDFGPQGDPNKKDDTTKKDDTAASPAKNYLQNPFKNLDTFPKIIKAVVNNIILPIAVPFIAIMIIYSGFLFVIAKKDGKVYSIERAKNTLKNTLIGAGLILGAFVIANALQATLNALLK